MKEQEIWKPIKGFDGYYEVSNMGNVKRLSRVVAAGYGHRTLKERLLKPRTTKSKSGLADVKLTMGSKTISTAVSRLVYSTFHDIELNLSLVVVQKDGNKMNNKLDNLKIITRRSVSQNKRSVTAFAGVKKNHTSYYATIFFCGKDLLLHSSKNKEECHKIYQLAKAMIDEYDKLKAGILSNSRLNNKLIVKSLPINPTATLTAGDAGIK